jgi:hypothetical protein
MVPAARRGIGKAAGPSVRWSAAMIEIIVNVCLLADPARCKDVHLTMLEGQVTPFQCMMYGQVEIAKWAEMNPKWQLKRWTCTTAGRFAEL